MSKRIILFTCLLCWAVVSFAQTKTVQGTVVDEDGTPISGVSVFQKGSKNGTQTGVEGTFSINVPSATSQLVVSSVGYATTTVNITGNNLSVTLKRNINVDDEIVVVGYQSVKRRDLTGSVSSVNSKQIKDIPVNSAAEALTGRLAGVQLTSTEGKPGAEVTIRVRGGGSITQDNTPLYIIDGIQVENGLSVISPQDIESVDVLKDASATAIYGARGANGVVIITTKKGRSGKTIISYNGFVGTKTISNTLDVMNPYDFVRYQYERSRGNATDSSNFVAAYGTTWDTLANYKNTPFIDWQDEMFGRNALFQTHNVSMSGGSAATQFNLGFTSNDEDGILLNTGYDRKLVNFSMDHNVNSGLKVGVTTRYNHTVVEGAGTTNDGSFSTNRLRHAVKYRPLLINGQDLTDYDAAYAAETNSNSLQLVNPILYNQSEYRRNYTDVLNLGGYVSLKLTPYLSFKTTFGLDLTNGIQNAFDDSLSGNSKLNGAGLPLANINTTKRITYNNSNVLTYSNAASQGNFAKRNSITAILGHEIYDRTDKAQYVETRYFPLGISAETALSNMNLGTPPAGVSQPKSTTFEATSRIVSGFARFNYSRDNKYLVSLAARSDGSSKFAKENRWSFFPSASVAWKLSEEKFFSKIKNTVNDAKVRFSYGQAGNNRISDYLYTTVYTASAIYGINDQLVTAYASPALANPDLVWERTNSQNMGVDLSFLKNRLQFTMDIYKNTTKDLLVNVPIPTSTGYTSQLQNVGSTQNKGVEFQLSGIPVSTKDFVWNANLNVSFNKNKVLSLGDYQSSYLQNSGWLGTNFPADYIVRVGDPVGSMWGFVTDGFYGIDDFNYNAVSNVYTLKTGVPNNGALTSTPPQPGVMRFKDINGDSLITDKDRTIIGNANPKFFGGLNQQFVYKNFDLSIFVNFQVGNDVYNANKLEFTTGYIPNANLLTVMNDRWTNINSSGQVVTDPTELAALNANAKIWTPSKQANSFILHSWAIEDGSFLRINNISLGYTFPESLTKRAKISKLRVYGTVNNLKVFTNYSGYDPEVSTRRASGVTPGVDYAAYPKSRSFIVGVNLSL